MDSERIAEDYDSTKISTKCPNCGLVYSAQKPDGKPPFFSIRKPPAEPPKPELIKPDVTLIPVGMFWCRKCNLLHRVASKIGIRHLKHRFIEEG